MTVVAPWGRTYRLRGQVAGRERRFLIGPAAVTLGSSPDQDVVLSDDGVSRRHARLTADGEALMVRDLGSKNGTFVDGQRLGAAEQRAIEVGSTVRFGPVELVVEEVAADDARVGLALDPGDLTAGAASQVTEPASTIGLPSGPAHQWLDLIDAVLARREAGDTSPSRLLAEVGTGLGARAALVTRGRAPAEVVAAWGDPRPIHAFCQRQGAADQPPLAIHPTADAAIAVLPMSANLC